MVVENKKRTACFLTGSKRQRSPPLGRHVEEVTIRKERGRSELHDIGDDGADGSITCACARRRYEQYRAA